MKVKISFSAIRDKPNSFHHPDNHWRMVYIALEAVFFDMDRETGQNWMVMEVTKYWDFFEENVIPCTRD